MATHPYVLCDVFTDRPLEGNQLAVFLEGAAIAEELLQPLAREMNLSETVFVLPAAAVGDAKVRIFTPTTELPFAGHPILGTAVVLGSRLRKTDVVLETGRGMVPVHLDGSLGRMAQPIPTVAPFEPTELLFAALGVGGSQLPVEVYDNGVQHLYVALASAADVAALRPDHSALARAVGERGVSCFAPQPDGVRWKNTHVHPRSRRRRGSGDRLGRRTAGAAPRPPRADRLRPGHRDLAGRRDAATVDVVRQSRRLGRRGDQDRGRWRGGRGGVWLVRPPLIRSGVGGHVFGVSWDDYSADHLG